MKVEFDDNGARVKISGEFTFTDHVAFKAIASRLFEGQGWPIVIDLTNSSSSTRRASACC